MFKWTLRCMLVLNLFVLGCANYDPDKSDKVLNHIGEYTGATPTTNPVPQIIAATASNVPYLANAVGIVNTALLLMHEFNARKRSGTKVTKSVTSSNA